MIFETFLRTMVIRRLTGHKFMYDLIPFVLSEKSKHRLRVCISQLSLTVHPGWVKLLLLSFCSLISLHLVFTSVL